MCFTSSDRRIAEQLGDLVGEPADVTALLEPPDELGRRGNADVRLQQRLLEPLPRKSVIRIERGDLDLLRQRAPRLRQRVAQAGEHSYPLYFRLRRGTRLAQQFAPATQR